MKKSISVLFLLLIATLGFAQETLNAKFEKKIEATIDHTVKTISCERLKNKLSTPNLYILDAREKNEYRVSHLENARWVGYDTFKEENIHTIPKDAIVVVYCSIGYRSEKIGEQLKKNGFSRVYNLYGGIFEWSNHSYPLVDNDNKKTSKVHAYDKDWGQWIDKGEKVYK